MIDKQRLEAKCSTWNIALTGTQLDQLDAFAQILVDYNQKVNLTAITDPEGIEDKHQLDTLLGMGCDFIQGYYFSKPVPEKDFIEVLKKNNTQAVTV